MKNLSRFDLSMIVAFVVVALLGGGGAYYLDAIELAAAQQDAQDANHEFERYSSNMVFLPTSANLKILKDNVELIQSQLDPLVQNHLQAPANKLSTIATENTVDWKHKLDDNVAKLNAAAKVHGVQVPENYYYGFSRYLNQAPAEEKTAVLSKQLLAIEEIATILINAPVNGIRLIRRTEEEGAGAPLRPGFQEGDLMPGHAVAVADGIYTDYPFEIEFDTTTDSFRKVVDDLMQSPYIFVIRSLSVQNSQPGSPQLDDLEKIVGAQSSPSVTDSPGAVAAAKSTAGPQYLFGNEILHVRARIDLVEWNGLSPDSADAGGTPPANPSPPSSHAHTGNR